MVNAAQAAGVVEEADPKHRGLVLGAYRFFADIGLVSGPVIVGALSNYYRRIAPFIAIFSI
jgi:hypothetical protein